MMKAESSELYLGFLRLVLKLCGKKLLLKYLHVVAVFMCSAVFIFSKITALERKIVFSGRSMVRVSQNESGLS